mgnify:CR=1 FL=1
MEVSYPRLYPVLDKVENKVENKSVLDQVDSAIVSWCSGNAPKTKQEEDTLLKQAAKRYKIKCDKNPGKLAELVVYNTLKRLGQAPKYQSIECNWLSGQKKITPDMVTSDYVVEVKSLRFFNGKGGKGNQGTATEKIDSIFRKYSGIPGKLLIVFCGDVKHDRNGKMYLEAFNRDEYNGNQFLKVVHENFRDKVIVTTFEDLEFKVTPSK